MGSNNVVALLMQRNWTILILLSLIVRAMLNYHTNHIVIDSNYHLQQHGAYERLNWVAIMNNRYHQLHKTVNNRAVII